MKPAHLKSATKSGVQAFILSYLFVAASANAQGITGATTTLSTAQTWFMTIIPIVAIVLGIGLWLMYSLTDMIRKENLYKWGIGLIGITVVSPLVGLAVANAG